MNNNDKILVVFCMLLSVVCVAMALVYAGYALAGWLAS